ncbi:MAG: hypothetical protein R6W84_09165 [Promethearchaeia archaeon]
MLFFKNQGRGIREGEFVKTVVCIDTGIITQYYSESPPDEILNLMNKIKSKELTAHII